jgi:lipopolysaccharide transport system ATP-binding protein
MSNLAIKIEHLSKMYKLGEINNGTLWRDIQTWIAIKQGKDDPHSKIGENKYSGDKDRFWALKDVSFDINQGDRLGIIGKNGAGKSTLLKILSRITTPTEGIIKIKGKVASLLEVGTGFHGELTGRENIYLNGAILGMKKRRIDELLDSIIDFSGIENHIDTPVKRYSSGMYVRLAFAIAAHLDCDILIADEVLAVGDAEFQKKALGKMHDLSTGQGKTVLFVSHNMASIIQLCNKGFLLKEGILDYFGKINDVIDKYMIIQELRSQLSISKIKNRQGNGIMRFTDIEFIDSKGVIRNTFTVGEEITLKIYYESTVDFNNAETSQIDIGIYNLLGIKIVWISSHIFIDKIKTSSNTISFKIPQLLLNEGTYNINLSCDANNELADWVTNVAKLHIVFKDFYKTGRKIPESQGYVITNFELL